MISLPDGIEEYALKHSDREASILYDLLKETRASVDQPEMVTGHMLGTLLRMLVGISQAKNVLEIGTFTGYSALSMAMSLPDDGKIITCDHDAMTTEIAQRYWDQSHLGKKIELRLGSALETIESLEGPFDFVFIDGEKTEYKEYWDAVLPKVRPKGMIVVDNVLSGCGVLKPTTEVDKAIASFNEYVRYDQRVQRLMITLRDGITIALKL